jgi:hypothetical protein
VIDTAMNTTFIYEAGDINPIPLVVDHRYRTVTIIVETLNIYQPIQPERLQISWEKEDGGGKSNYPLQDIGIDETVQLKKIELKEEYFTGEVGPSGTVTLKLQPPKSFRKYDIEGGVIDLSNMHFITIDHTIKKVFPEFLDIQGCTHVAISLAAVTY